MPKKSVLNRNERRIKVADKYRAKIEKLKIAVRDLHASDEEREKARFEIQKLPRNASRSRQRNRCKLCGRPRAYNRLTGLCRIHMRAATVRGWVPGMHKASW